MCCQSGRGRLAKRIFGNRIPPEDRLNQFLAYLVLFDPVSGHELLIDSGKSGPSRSLRFNSSFRQSHKSATHCDVALLCDASYLHRQLGWNSHTLTKGRVRSLSR